MPTQEIWLSEAVIQTTWTAPLTDDDMQHCFHHLTQMIAEKAQRIDIFFDIREAGAIPVSAPIYAIRSRFLVHPNTHRVVVVSNDSRAQRLAGVASFTTRKTIEFFTEPDAAMAHLTT